MRLWLLFCLVLGCAHQTGLGQDAQIAPTPPRLAALPSEQTFRDGIGRSDSDVTPRTTSRNPSAPAAFPQRRFQPAWSLESEWLGAGDSVSFLNSTVGVSLPLYPVFGPPPPIVQIRVGQLDFLERDEDRLPDQLWDVSGGVSWVRRLNDRWTLRTMANLAFATDGDNQSGDAWQFRGGIFAIYQQNPCWTWTFGAIALGRDDLPAVPALGVIWQPRDDLRFDLILPRPRIQYLLAERSDRQHWAYLGGGFSGGTWAVESQPGMDEELTYRDWRIVIGWESTPRKPPGQPFVRGRKLGLEIGYAFARDFEFSTATPTIDLDETLLLQARISF